MYHKVEGDGTDKIGLMEYAHRSVLEHFLKPGDYLLTHARYSAFEHFFEPALKTREAIRLVGTKPCARRSKRFGKIAVLPGTDFTNILQALKKKCLDESRLYMSPRQSFIHLRYFGARERS